MNRGGWRISLVGLVALASCQPVGTPPLISHSGAVQLGPGTERTTKLAADRIKMGQSVFLPVYSTIASADNARPINLAVTITIRNLDRQGSIVIEAIQYLDSGGKLVRKSIDTPIRVGPLAAFNLFLRESDNSGGPSPSFLVDWVAETTVEPPLVQAVMISTAGSLGLTFTTTGRVITAPQ